MSDSKTFAYSVEIEEPGRVVAFTLSGRLGPEEAEAFRASAEAEYRAGGRRFVFDVGQLAYIGSAGLQVFAFLASRVKGTGVVCLCDLTPAVRSVLDITKLAQLLQLYKTRAEAIDAARIH